MAVASPTIPDRTMDVPGGSLAYWDTGGPGPAVVLMHAATHCARSWGHQREAFADRGYRVVGYSRRGHRGSSAITKEDPGVAADDLDALASGLGIERFALVAIAAGGFFATDYALAHPDRVTGLAVGSSMMGIGEEGFLGRVFGLHPPGFQELPAEFRELGVSYRADCPEGVDLWRALHEEALSGDGFVLQGLSEEITWERLEALRVPALLLGCGADLIIPAPVTRDIAARIPGASFVLLSDSGHTPTWETPAAFNDAVLGFLDATGAPRA